MTAYVATLNLPDTLNFKVDIEDSLQSPGTQSASQSATAKQTVPKPNLLESLSRAIGSTSTPPSAATSPREEFGPGNTNRRDFFESIKNALSGLEIASERGQVRKKLTQPPSRATSPQLPKADIPRTNYGTGIGPPGTRKKGYSISDKMFANADWTPEKQQFGVNGGLINAVRSAETAGAFQNYQWIGTLGMVAIPRNQIDGSLQMP